jgi:hypothetical protein
MAFGATQGDIESSPDYRSATLLGSYDVGYRMNAMTDAVVAGDAALTKEMVRVLYPYVSRPMRSGEFLAMFSPREGKTVVGK